MQEVFQKFQAVKCLKLRCPLLTIHRLNVVIDRWRDWLRGYEGIFCGKLCTLAQLLESAVNITGGYRLILDFVYGCP